MYLLSILKPLHRIMDTFTHRLFTWHPVWAHCYTTQNRRRKLEMFSVMKI